MQITSIEVIRGNPGVAGNPVVMGVPVGEKLPVEVGDTVRVHMVVDHRGPRIENAEVYTAIGWQTGIIIPEFIEAFVGRTPGLTFDQSLDFVTYPIVCDVPITDISGFVIEFGLYGNALDIYAKIINVPGPDIFTDPFYYKVIEVAEEGEYEEVQHTIYPFSYTYEGNAETCVFDFKLTPEQIPWTEWLGERIVKSFVTELEKEGAKLLELKVSRDITPPLWTNYRVEVTATASPLAWNLIIIGVLAILFIIAIYFTIKLVDQTFFNRTPGLDEVKPGWGKDTLIKTIQDSEEYWERPLTPIETLEGMSEEELRHHLNEIAEEEVPPVSWWPIAVVGGLGVLGVVAALAMTGIGRKE